MTYCRKSLNVNVCYGSCRLVRWSSRATRDIQWLHSFSERFGYRASRATTIALICKSHKLCALRSRVAIWQYYDEITLREIRGHSESHLFLGHSRERVSYLLITSYRYSLCIVSLYVLIPVQYFAQEFLNTCILKFDFDLSWTWTVWDYAERL